MTTSGRSSYLGRVLISFFKFNTYPIKKFVIIKDGTINEEIEKLIPVYKNITWIIANKNIGQLAAIDVAYKLIDT